MEDGGTGPLKPTVGCGPTVLNAVSFFLMSKVRIVSLITYLCGTLVSVAVIKFYGSHS